MEAQSTGGDEAEVEQSPNTPLTPSCDPGCTCVCHLQWPGMKLVWVPVDAAEEEGGGDEEELYEEELYEGEEVEEEEEEEEDSRAEDEVDRTSVADESQLLKEEKAKFHHSLGVLLADGHRRRSDPGPHAVLASLAATRSQSPPVPPKQTQPTHHRPAQEEEESIYEATLPVLEVPLKKTPSACKELDIPLITVRKPARRSKLSYSTSDPTSEFQSDLKPVTTPDDVPPAIPPRMPLNQDSRSLTPVHRAGIPLPQPTVEEWRNLRPSSPSSSTGGGLSPRRAITPPPASPHRPPPPPPKTDPRRLSSASLQSLTQRKGN